MSIAKQSPGRVNSGEQIRAEEIKLAALTDLLSEIAGRDVLVHSGYYERDAEIRIAGVAGIFSQLRELLDKCKCAHEGNGHVWSPFWIPVRRENHSELAALYPDYSNDEILELVDVYFPKEEAWLRVTFFADDDRHLALQLAPLSFYVVVDLKDDWVTVRGGYTEPTAESFLLFSNWLFQQISQETGKIISGSEQYKQDMDKRIPLTERFAKIQRKRLWEALPDIEHYIVSEMTPSEIEEFQGIAVNLSRDVVLSQASLLQFSAADYFHCCSLCFDAAGLDGDDRLLTPRERYQKYADNRHGGLLNLPEESPDAFMTWLVSSEWHGAHPWEIRRGGNSTHISLAAFADCGGVRLILSGSATSRAAETMKMALTLWKNNIQVILDDVNLHLSRVGGKDWIGLYPDSYGLDGQYFFPRDLDITDYFSWGEYADCQQLLRNVVLLPLF